MIDILRDTSIRERTYFLIITIKKYLFIPFSKKQVEKRPPIQSEKGEVHKKLRKIPRYHSSYRRSENELPFSGLGTRAFVTKNGELYL